MADTKTGRKIGDDAEEGFENIKEQASEVWDQTKERAKQAASQVQGYAKENPWQMAAIGAAVGFTLALLLTRRRD